MTIASSTAQYLPVANDPLLVCPSCHGSLQWSADRILCSACDSQFGFENGFPNLVLGERFEDEPNPELTAYEEECNQHTATQYFLPLFRKIFSAHRRTPRILSLGCGTGADVDVLNAAGFSVTGIDCGARSCAWPNRVAKDRLLLANGKSLPFETGSFDAVYCGCVFPHVGTIGDSHDVRSSYAEERASLALEMGRVLKSGGHVVVSSPNRRFPLDIFHGRSAEQPLPRINRANDPFLLSFADYEQIFRPADCSRFQLLPVNGYWGFVRRKRTVKGRLTMLPVEALFNMVSSGPGSALRNTFVNPWLVVHAVKAVA